MRISSHKIVTINNNIVTPLIAKNYATETKDKLYGIFNILDNFCNKNYYVINFYTRLND